MKIEDMTFNFRKHNTFFAKGEALIIAKHLLDMIKVDECMSNRLEYKLLNPKSLLTLDQNIKTRYSFFVGHSKK